MVSTSKDMGAPEIMILNSWRLDLVGSNVFVTVKAGNPCVNIRQFWRPNKEESVVPTKKGLCLRPFEFSSLKSIVSKIEELVPELDAVVPCYARDDHQNQLGMLRCKTCNPDEYMNW